MNLTHLKYAIEIDKTGSINKAAENLFMGQPNLSRSIKELEASLGITIFERSAKGMITTPDGSQFLQYARKILEQVDEVEAIYKNGLASKKRFSVSVPRASYISEAFAQFSKSIDKEMQAELFYKETNAQKTVKNVIESDYKLGIIRYAVDYDKNFKEMLTERGLVYETVAEFVYALIMNKEHPLAMKEEIVFDDLAPYFEINHADLFVPILPFAANRKEELPNNVNRRIHVFERASQFNLLSENKETYMWVSPVPQKILDCYGLIQKKCVDNKKVYRDLLIYRKDYRLTDLDDKFVTELSKAKRKYL